jgi:hypothetical protein
MDPVVMSFFEGVLIIFASVMYGFTYYTLKKTVQKFRFAKCFQSTATGASYERIVSYN